MPERRHVMERIAAIVMTCQRYMPIAEHMIDCYRERWPSHPFLFRLPDGTASRELARRHTGQVELVPTDEGEARGKFRASVLGLLDGIHDDTWVYWCIDDKYVEWIDVRVAQSVVEMVSSIDDPAWSGVCFARARHLERRASGNDAAVKWRTLTLTRRFDYRQIWLHQFLRAKVLRTLFSGFPQVISAAKQMDALHRAAQLPDGHRLYVLDRNAVVFGESTIAGRLTANCAARMRARRGVPRGFEVDSAWVTIGQRPTRAGRLADSVRRRLSRLGALVASGAKRP